MDAGYTHWTLLYDGVRQKKKEDAGGGLWQRNY